MRSKTLVVDAADWCRTDLSTIYTEVVGEDDGQRLVRVAVTHAHDGTGLVVQLTGTPGSEGDDAEAHQRDPGADRKGSGGAAEVG
ncbi:hypothetical protein ABZ914_08100 [Spirillospora sp. NPDC046719]